MPLCSLQVYKTKILLENITNSETVLPHDIVLVAGALRRLHTVSIHYLCTTNGENVSLKFGLSKEHFKFTVQMKTHYLLCSLAQYFIQTVCELSCYTCLNENKTCTFILMVNIM